MATDGAYYLEFFQAKLYRERGVQHISNFITISIQ